MNKLNNKGFSILEGTLVLLIVMALGGIGWYVYSNNSENNDSTSTNNQTVQIEDEVADVTNEEVLTFSQWGAELPLGEVSTKYTVSEYKDYSSDVDNPGHGVYYINLDIEGCGSDVSVGVIERYSADSVIVQPGLLGEEAKGKTWKQAILEQQGDKAVVIGDYVFTFGTPQSGCASDPFSTEGKKSNDIQSQATTEISSLFSGLRAVTQ